MTLFLACALTVLLETGFLSLLVSREASFLAVCALANTATNLALNLTLARAAGFVDITWFVYPLEAAAVLAEYGVYTLVLGRSRRLFLLTLAANLLSYGAGLLIFGHV